MQHEHWTLDEELLAAYALGRLSESEREPLARHLEACTECRKRVEEEQVLAAGVQRAGRDDLKARLRQRLGQQHLHDVALGKAADAQMAASYRQPDASMEAGERALPLSPQKRGRAWIYAMATAACIVIVTGVGILNRWWSHDTIQTVSVEEERAVATPPAAQAEKSSPESYATRSTGGATDSRQASPAPATVPGERPAPSNEVTLSSVSAEQKNVLKQKAVPGAGEDRSEETAQFSDADRLGKADQRKEAERSVKKEPPSAEAMTGAGIAEEGSWIEGETAYIRMDKGANIATDEANNALRVMSEKDGRSQQAVTRLNARIEQRPLADAPIVRQQQQRRQQSQAVLANIQQSDSTLHLTLYPDPQLNERDLRQAQVYRLTPDTIVVVLPGQMIRYRVGSQAALPAR